MAEFVMKELCRQQNCLDEFEIASAAVSTEELGNDIYPPAKRKLSEKHIPFTSHSARQITRSDYAYFDYIICADHSNLRWLARIIGDDSANKVSLMMAWSIKNHKSQITNIGNVPDVSDPWYTGDFEAAFRDIDLSCRAILNQLR